MKLCKNRSYKNPYHFGNLVFHIVNNFNVSKFCLTCCYFQIQRQFWIFLLHFIAFTDLEVVDWVKGVNTGDVVVLESEQEVSVVLVCIAQVLSHQQEVRFEGPGRRVQNEPSDSLERAAQKCLLRAEKASAQIISIPITVEWSGDIPIVKDLS